MQTGGRRRRASGAGYVPLNFGAAAMPVATHGRRPVGFHRGESNATIARGAVAENCSSRTTQLSNALVARNVRVSKLY